MKKDLTVENKPNGKKEYSLHSEALETDLIFVGPIGEGGVAKTFKFKEKGSAGKNWVIKEYPKPDSEAVKQVQVNIKNNLKELISQPVKGVGDIMVPPIEVLDFPKSGTFGYIMPYVDLREFLSVSRLLKSKQFPDAQIICKMCKNLARFFVALNLGSGKCYKDINEGNIYLNPTNGEVRVIDNDNVGAPQIKTIEGTSQYRAPEILTNNVLPDRYTDRFQLAAYLLRLFVGAFPMEGRYMISYCKSHGSIYDNAVAKVVLGEKAVFIFNENDKSNALPNNLDEYKVQTELWKRLPPEIKTGLMNTFVDGLKEREERTPPKRWLDIFENLSNSLVRCPSCGRWTFGSAEVCQQCGTRIPKEKCLNCHKMTPRDVVKCVLCGKPHKQQQVTVIRCPSCGTSNPHNEVICRNCKKYMFTICQKCGSKVAVTEKVCSSCGNTQVWQKCGNQKCAKWYPQSILICPICKFDPGQGSSCSQCGRRLQPGTTVCPQCGAQTNVVPGMWKNGISPSGSVSPADPQVSPVAPQSTTGTNQGGLQSGWTVGRTELSIRYGVRLNDNTTHHGTLGYTIGQPKVVHGSDLSTALPSLPLLCLFSKPDIKMLGLQNMTNQTAQIYKLQGDVRVAVETISPKDTKGIADDDLIKFEHLTLWIKGIDVIRP